MKGISQMLYKTYRDREVAKRAYSYVLDQSWAWQVMINGVVTAIREARIPLLMPQEIITMQESAYHTLLNAGEAREHWYVVFKGI